MRIKRIIKREPDAAVWDKVGWMRSIGCSEEEINEALKPAKFTKDDIKILLLRAIDDKYAHQTLTEELELTILNEKLTKLQIMTLQPGDVIQAIPAASFVDPKYHAAVAIEAIGVNIENRIPQDCQVYFFTITSKPPEENSIKRFRYKVKHPEGLNLPKGADTYIDYAGVNHNLLGKPIEGNRFTPKQLAEYNNLKLEIAKEVEKDQDTITELRKVISDPNTSLEDKAKAQREISKIENKPKRFAEDEFADEPGRLEKEDLLGLVASIERDWEELTKYSKGFRLFRYLYRYFINSVKRKYGETKEKEKEAETKEKEEGETKTEPKDEPKDEPKAEVKDETKTETKAETKEKEEAEVKTEPKTEVKEKLKQRIRKLK